MKTPVLFCNGLYSPRAFGSVAGEWRDYILGLDLLGLPLGIVDPLGPPPSRKWMSALASADRFAPPRTAASFLRALLAERGRSRPGVMPAAETCRLDALGRLRRLRSPRCVVAVVDFYDAARWGGVLWRTVVESRIRALLPSCRHIVWVARAICETTALPADLLAEARAFDELWVPSDLHLRVFAPCGVPLVKIPEAVDTAHFRPRARRFPVAGRRACAFLALSGFLPGRHSREFSEVRKASDLTVEAFVREFGRDEPVCLLIKGAPDLRRMKARILEVLHDVGEPSARLEQIVILDQVPHADLPALYASVDAVVLVSRGEGWGRPLMEALAVGTPVVATRFGGGLEFMDEGSAFLVNCRLDDVARRLPGHEGWGQWAEPDIGHLRAVLRQIVTTPESARAKARRGAAVVRRRFNRDAVARRMRRRLRALR